MLTDPIADMLTRIRNIVRIKGEKADIPASGIKMEIAKILKEEGFIKSYKILRDKKQKSVLRIILKYSQDGGSILSGLKRISKPGRRVYVSKDKLPNVMSGVGVAIITTHKGVLTNKKCSDHGVGGEVLCYIW